ncbi:MAG: cytidine deaminase [Synergistaceae bacterium]|jgi:cytidine deaminase|nr:cytidine deaminase [Synergistaceae bacterium]
MEVLSSREFRAAFGIEPLDLMRTAEEYMVRAYAPYSNFPVGAAILLEGGAVTGGCNVENASYGLSLCAERVAMSKAVSEGNRKPLAIAVSALPGVFCPPCGACRQFLSEFNPNLIVVLKNGSKLDLFGLDALFPYSFALNDTKNG